MRRTIALLCAASWLAGGSLGAAPARAGHEHRAPHGGTIVAFGDEFAHVELVLDAAKGTLRAYVLDGEAEHGVQVRQADLGVVVEPLQGSAFTVRLSAVENALTGETVGNSSEFAGRDDRLVGLSRFAGSILRLDVKSLTFERVAFRFPEGNEGGHADDAERVGRAGEGAAR